MCLLFQGADIECRNNMIPYQRIAGDMFYYKAGENHKTVRTIKDSKNINIEFKDEILKKDGITFVPDFNFENPTPKLLFLRILNELLTNDNISSSSIEALAFQLFEFDNSVKRDIKPKWAALIDDYFKENWASDFSLIDIAAEIGVHPITISKNFKKYYTCTFGEYRRMLKIHNSIPLIKNSEMSLSQVAYACGFSDQSHFIRNFKKYAAFLPNDFRRV